MSKNDYCLNKAAPAGSNLYYSSLFCSEAVKNSLYTLHAFASEIGDIFDHCTDPGVARVKLHWWHEEIQRIYTDQARHPVGKAIASLLTAFPVKEEFLHQFVKHNEQRLDIQQLQTFEELNATLRQGPGLIWELTAEICSYLDQNTPLLANKTGCLISTYEYLQNLSRYAARGHIPLPDEEIKKAGLSLTDFINSDNNKLHVFIIKQTQYIIHHLDKIYSEYPVVDRRSQLCCLIMNRLITSLCKEVVKDNINLHHYKITLTPLHKLWIAWRTKLHAT